MGKQFEKEIGEVQKQELMGENLDLDDDEEQQVDVEEKKKMKAKKDIHRKQNRGDTTSNMLYKMKAMNARRMMNNDDMDQPDNDDLWDEAPKKEEKK